MPLTRGACSECGADLWLPFTATVGGKNQRYSVDEPKDPAADAAEGKCGNCQSKKSNKGLEKSGDVDTSAPGFRFSDNAGSSLGFIDQHTDEGTPAASEKPKAATKVAEKPEPKAKKQSQDELNEAAEHGFNVDAQKTTSTFGGGTLFR